MVLTYIVITVILFNRQICTNSVAIDDNNSMDDMSFNVESKLDQDSSLSDDVIELNVGGQKMTTLRSTLTIISHSRLARIFDKTNPDRNVFLDKDGNVFFDYNPMYFNYLLDQLRELKHLPKILEHKIQFRAPYISSQLNFTHMLADLGLMPKNILSPMEGTHTNLTVKSLTGWKQCYHSTYNIPFDFSVIQTACNGSRILVACRSIHTKSILTLAAIGQYEDILHPCIPRQCKLSRKSKKNITCSSNYQCVTQAKRGVGWYSANNQTWGFVRGSLSFPVNPCDSSDLDSDYRLCWTSQSNKKNTNGDRCGINKNLQNTHEWERLIYYTVQ